MKHFTIIFVWLVTVLYGWIFNQQLYIAILFFTFYCFNNKIYTMMSFEIVVKICLKILVKQKYGLRMCIENWLHRIVEQSYVLFLLDLSRLP